MSGGPTLILIWVAFLGGLGVSLYAFQRTCDAGDGALSGGGWGRLGAWSGLTLGSAALAAIAAVYGLNGGWW